MKVPGFLNSLFGNGQPQRFRLVQQRIPVECGAACLCMIFKYLGDEISLDEMNRMLQPDPETGVSLLEMQNLAERHGYSAGAYSVGFDDLVSDKRLFPVIAHWEADHFIVLYRADKDHVWVADPAMGCVKYNREQFCGGWYCNPDHEDRGVILVIE